MNHQYQGIHIQLPNKSESMSTEITDKINQILIDRYPNNYAGRQNIAIRQLHAEMREKLGEEKFLEYLEEQEQNNPRPKYESPHLNTENKFEWTDELLKKLLHAATGNIKDFVTNEDGFLSKFKASHSKGEYRSERGWEIVKAKTLLGIIHTYSKAECEGCTIHEVRRISDNTMWTVGEDTPKGKITQFDDRGANLYVLYDLGGFDYLHEVKKSPEVKEPLFTTTDGKQIFHTDSYWAVNQNFKINEAKTHLHDRPCYFEGVGKTFSTKEAAERYILYNKPILSIQDFLDCEEYGYEDKIEVNKHFLKLKQLAQSKINGGTDK